MATMIPISDYAHDTAVRIYARDRSRYRGLTNEEVIQDVVDELTALGAEEQEVASIALAVKALVRQDAPPSDTARVNPMGRMYRP